MLFFINSDDNSETERQRRRRCYSNALTREIFVQIAYCIFRRFVL